MDTYDFDKWIVSKRHFVPNQVTGYKCCVDGHLINLTDHKKMSIFTLPAAIAIGILLNPEEFTIYEYSCKVNIMQAKYLTYGQIVLPYQCVRAESLEFFSVYPRGMYAPYLEGLRQEIQDVMLRAKAEQKAGAANGR